VPLTRLIGRKEDIEAVTARFTQTRMVTLTGSGGVGKTRLAIAVAETLSEEFAEGGWMVELAALSDPTLVASAVAQALQVQEQPGQAIEETLKQALASRSLLLVLDNCEHLLEACAHLARELLSGCAKLRVLATSRQALGLTGEWVYRVPSLQTPPPLKSLGSPPDKEGMTYLLEYEAVQLFVERAAARNTTWKLTGPQVLAAAAICRELDGIPLAIEMAAARARSLSVEEIRARLGDRFALLRAGDRSVLPRHQTLRATLDWSYQLLSEAEQVLLSRLSVFAGGWTLEAAEAVCKDPNDITTAIQRQSGGTEEAAGPSSSFILHPSSSVLDLLTSLVDQSLVQVEVREGGTRYWLLETIRQYAAEQLRERGEEEAIRERHLRCFLELATEREDSNMGDGKNIMQTEIDNLHAALKWGLQPKGKRGEVEPGEPSEIEMAVLQLAREFCWFWYFRGYSRGGWGYLREALRREEAAGPSRVRAEALASAGFLALSQRDYEAAEALLEQSMALFKALGDPHGMQWPLQDLGLLAYVRDDYGTARVLFEQKLAFCRGQGDRGGIIESLPLLGMVVRDQGDYAMARALLEEALEICRETGDKVAIANACVDLAHVALAEGDYEGARTLHEEAQSLRHDLGHFDIFALGLADVGYAAWLQQDYAGVKRVVREAMSLTADLEQSGYLTRWHAVCQLECLELLAGLAQSEGEAARSACLFGAAEGLRKRLDLACQYWWQRAQRRLLGALERLPKTKEVQSAREVGRAMSLEQAIAFAIADPEPEATSAPWYNGPG
jgi:non-specific serine/threonine protein kinase